MLADALVAEVPRRRHDRVVRRFGVFGFRIGVGLYLLSLLVQLIFSL
jgi:hypothetical protein